MIDLLSYSVILFYISTFNYFFMLYLKISLQNFAKSLLDVADNLGRASSVVKVRFSKIDVSEDSSGSVPLLNTLLEGVDMTNKQLADVIFLYYSFYLLVVYYFNITLVTMVF